MGSGWDRQGYAGRAIDQASIDGGLRQYMLSIYNYMAGGLAITGLVAYLVAQSPQLVETIWFSPLKWVVMLAPLGVVWAFSANLHKMSRSTAQTVFLGYAALMGLSLSFIFLAYTQASIARVFFISAASFGATSLYGYTTKRDLSKLGAFLFMGLIGIIIASLVNMLVQSSALQFAVSVIGVLVFTGLTAYDTQSLKEMYSSSYDRDSLGRIAIMGALRLYLDFLNLFMMLLRLFGDRR